MSDSVSKLIKYEGISYQEILELLRDVVESEDDYVKWKDHFESSTGELLLKLLAGMSTLLSVKYMNERAESYLSKAKLASSIYDIASTLGYLINRRSSPVIELIYTGDEPIVVETGDVLGTYLDQELIFFDPDNNVNRITLLQGSTVKVVVGTYREIEDVIPNETESMTVNYDIRSSDPKYQIDNQLIKVDINDERVAFSKNTEDYILYECITERTKTPRVVELLLSSKSLRFGVPLRFTVNPIVIRYVETLGKINIDISELKIEDNFGFSKVLTFGTDEDPLNKIKVLAPFYFTALRRMVTIADHKYLMMAFEDILDVNVVKLENEHPLLELIKEYETDGIDSVPISVLKDMKFRCCTLDVYYVKAGSNSTSLEFTDIELNRFKKYIDQYRMKSINYIISPARSKIIPLAFDVKLLKDTDYQLFLDYLEAIKAKYNLQIGYKFVVGQFIADLHKMIHPDLKYPIVRHVEFTELQPNYECEYDEYLWLDVTINYIQD